MQIMYAWTLAFQFLESFAFFCRVAIAKERDHLAKSANTSSKKKKKKN